ncbi:MAG: nitroreductase family protein [Chloroflexota bacterium]|nr:nitroreductase family protein [Chloroflexota bacterium]
MTVNKHDFYLVIDKRRTVRNFEDTPVEQEKLHRILEAGMKAPSYNHMREWHFIFLKDPVKRQAVLELGDAFSRTPDRKFLDETLSKITNPYQREVYSYSVPLQERMLLTAPEILIVCFRMAKPLSECKTLFELNNFASVWLVIENILLAMAAEGLYGVTMVPFRTAGLKKLLGIPDDYEVATFIPIGYPKTEPLVRQVKANLEERIHLNEW